MSEECYKNPPPAPPEKDLDWTVFKALSESNAASRRALEEHVFYAQFADRADAGSLGRHLDDAIARHERILEDLRFAARTLDERDDR